MPDRLHRLAVITALLAACASSKGGDNTPAGGQPGTTCNSLINSEGCLDEQRVRCDAATSKWVSIGMCPAGTICQLTTVPSATGTGTKVAGCGSGGTPTGPTCGDGKCASSETTAACAKDCPLKAGSGCTLSSDHKYFEPIVESLNDKGWLAHYQIVMDCTFKKSCLDADGHSAQQSCISLCIKGKIAVSTSCATCYGAYAGWCASQKCQSSCAKTVASSCVKCVTDNCNVLLGTCLAGNSSATKPTCGNSKCEAPIETPKSCSKDCKTHSCGDGKCDADETTACPSDCKAPSGSCAGKCGKFQKGDPCQCDDDCAKYDDCCPDKDAQCGD